MNTPVPSHPFSWPGDHSAITQIQSLKAAGKSANPLVKSPGTQGLPKVVSNLNVAKKNLSSTQVQLTVSFTHNVGDPYFTSAQIYIRYGSGVSGKPPVLVSGGSQAPIVFTVTRTKVPTTVIVVSTGNWGSTPISTSPSKQVNIA
jgi:hypothetical protein